MIIRVLRYSRLIALGIAALVLFPILGQSGIWDPYELDAADLARKSGEDLAAQGLMAAVRDVTFDVREGEIFILMGLSGSGKSTLIRCINRLEIAEKGQILVNSTDLSQPSREAAKVRSEIGMVRPNEIFVQITK